MPKGSPELTNARQAEIMNACKELYKTMNLTSSATPYFDGVASTQYLAEYINSKVGGDIAKLTPVKDYPESYNDCANAQKTKRTATLTNGLSLFLTRNTRSYNRQRQWLRPLPLMFIYAIIIYIYL